MKTLNFIKKATIIHGGKYNYSLVNYKTNKTKVDIICNIHGAFSQAPELLHVEKILSENLRNC